MASLSHDRLGKTGANLLFIWVVNLSWSLSRPPSSSSLDIVFFLLTLDELWITYLLVRPSTIFRWRCDGTFLVVCQSAILGMHSIVSRPMVVGGNIVPRPMMYIALTYDHRLIDGREAVFFLRRIKDVVEDPRRLLLDIWRFIARAAPR